MEETITLSIVKKEKDIEKRFAKAIESCLNDEKEIEKLILKEVGNNVQVSEFIKKHFDLSKQETYLTSTSTRFNIDRLKNNNLENLINLKKINDIRYINKFFESVNEKLPIAGLFFGAVITYPNRKKALLEKYPVILNWFVYFFDTIFKRILPKLKLTKKIYFYLTKGKGRVLSKAETFGRLYSCGFEIVDEKIFDNVQYFLAKKITKPFYDNNPTYGPIIRLKRIGKSGKEFNVYKLRTMHPYSEYLQEYVYNKNKLQEGGKIKNDFRISPEGKIFRKIWLDEIPMIINILKGDMKLVGVRPLSTHFFSLYTKELQDLRTQFKPGFIPPFYADLPKTMEEIMMSEKKYLKKYKVAPFKTDLNYLFVSLKNVFINGARSN